MNEHRLKYFVVGRADQDVHLAEGWIVEMPVGSVTIGMQLVPPEEGAEPQMCVVAMAPENGVSVPHGLFAVRGGTMVRPLMGQRIGAPIGTIMTGHGPIVWMRCEPWPTSSLVGVTPVGQA